MLSFINFLDFYILCRVFLYKFQMTRLYSLRGRMSFHKASSSPRWTVSHYNFSTITVHVTSLDRTQERWAGNWRIAVESQSPGERGERNLKLSITKRMKTKWTLKNFSLASDKWNCQHSSSSKAASPFQNKLKSFSFLYFQCGLAFQRITFHTQNNFSPNAFLEMLKLF